MNVIGVEINGIGTNIAIRQYTNCLFVIISQTGKLKNCIQIEKEDSNPAFLPTNSQTVYRCSIKFGPDSLEDLAAVQYLCERLSFPNNTMISVCLIENTPSVLAALSEILLKHKAW